MASLLDRMETVSLRSYRSNHNILSTEQGGQEPEEMKLEKKQRFWDFFTMILSISYAIFIIILGILLYSSDLGIMVN